MLMRLAIPPPGPLAGELTQLRAQRSIVDHDGRVMTLRRSMLPGQTARPTLGEPEPLLQSKNSTTPPGRAQKFPDASSFSP